MSEKLPEPPEPEVELIDTLTPLGRRILNEIRAKRYPEEPEVTNTEDFRSGEW